MYPGGIGAASHYKATLVCGDRSMAFYYSYGASLGDPEIDRIVDSLIADIKAAIKGVTAESTWEEKFQCRASERRANEFIALMGDKFIEVEKEIT